MPSASWMATLAQVPGQQPAEDALSNIANQGILGSLCVVLIVACFFLVRALLKEKDKRLVDQEKVLAVIEKHNAAAKDLAVEATKSQTELQNTMTNQATALGSLQQSINRLEGKVG